MVGTGFQRHVGRGAFDGFTASLCIAQGHDFGVRATGLLGVALANHPAVGGGEDAANAGVGVGKLSGKSPKVSCVGQRLDRVGRGHP